MSEQEGRRLRLGLSGLAILAELAHLAWQHVHGGVQRHHFLHRADLPAISNWWGLLVLPALTWFATGRIGRRLAGRPAAEERRPSLSVRIAMAGFGSLLLGILLSVCFANHWDSAASQLFQAMLFLTILLPVYRAEYLLGFVAGMAFTFGAVLPAIIGGALAAVSAFLHLVIRPGLVRLWKALRRGSPPRG